jgi:hypothetical protein
LAFAIGMQGDVSAANDETAHRTTTARRSLTS